MEFIFPFQQKKKKLKYLFQSLIRHLINNQMFTKFNCKFIYNENHELVE